MSHHLERESVAIAMLFAILPLLPAGPQYLGFEGANAVDWAVVVLLIVWLLGRIGDRRRPQEIGSASGGAVVGYAWAVFLAVATGGMLVGVAAENRIGSPVFAALAPEFLRRMVRPVVSTADPFYPARVWLTFLEGFLVFAALGDFSRRARDPWQFVRVVSWGWLAGLGVVSLFAIAQYLTAFQLHPRWVEVNAALVRAHATLDDPNMLASYLLLGVGLATAVALSEHRRMLALTALALAVLANLAMLTTVSRIGLAAVPLTALLLVGFAPTPHAHPLLLRIWQFRGFARGLLAGLAVLALALMVARVTLAERTSGKPTNPVEAIEQTLDPRVPLDDVLKDRLTYWRAALRMSGEHPVTGIGLGRYPGVLPAFRSQWVELGNAHNFFLQLLAELGILGMLTFAAVLATAIGVLASALRAPDGRRAGFAAGALFGTVGFSMTLLTGHPLMEPSAQTLLASALALGLAGSASGPGGARASAQPIRRVAALAAILASGVYGVAAWRTPSPPPRESEWGYSWGLYPEEGGFFPEAWGLTPGETDAAPGPPGTRAASLRWTAARAVLEVQVPDAAVEYVIPFAAVLPSLPSHGGASQFVRIFYGDTPRVIEVKTSDLHTVRVPLTPDVLDGQRRLVVRIAVAPHFVPADLGLSRDKRQLGVHLFRPRFVRR